MKTFKNKEELVKFVKHQTNAELINDPDNRLNSKKKFLYTEIKGMNEYSVLSILRKYGIKYEKHHRDNYWVCVK